MGILTFWAWVDFIFLWVMLVWVIVAVTRIGWRRTFLGGRGQEE